MDAYVEVAIFLVLPYAAVAAFVGGVIYRLHQWLAPRGRTGLRSVAVVPNTFGPFGVLWDLIKRVLGFYTLPKMEKDRTLIVGTMMFHYGIWIVLLSHLGLVVPLPITAQQHDLLGLYVGGTAGLLTLAGLLVLIARRVGTSRMRQISFFEDYFLLGFLLAIIVFGLLQTLVFKPDYIDTVSPWLVSILTLQPNLTPIASVGIFTILHVTLALVFIAYVPWAKMGHTVALLFNPTVTGPSFPVGVGSAPAMTGARPPGRR
ncbi:MAG: respiratory nitrate reductase subunit gamma [Thermoplasmata archaeon]